MARSHSSGPIRRALARCLLAVVLAAVSTVGAALGHAPAFGLTPLSTAQRADLLSLASRTWDFFAADVDPRTNLPREGIAAAGPTPGAGTASPTGIGLYLTAVVAARDLGIINAQTALSSAATELHACQALQTYQGFPMRWYNTATGAATTNLVSTVDSAWYEQGLIVARNAFPTLSAGFTSLIDAMDWRLMYDPTLDLLDTGYTVGTGLTKVPYDYIYGGPRIADYMAIGSGTVPGSLWWGPRRTETPPKHPIKPPRATGSTVTFLDPQSHVPYAVFEGHYTYAGITFVPSYYGSMFEALAPNLVVPETTWAPASFGVNAANIVAAQQAYAQQALNSSIWGLSPATVPGTLTGYSTYGASPLGASTVPAPSTAFAPYAAALALTIDPQAAYLDITRMRTSYPALDTARGLLDSVDPVKGTVAGRSMAVSQAVIIDSIDNALTMQSLQTYLAGDPFGARIEPYLRRETFSITPVSPQGQ